MKAIQLLFVGLLAAVSLNGYAQDIKLKKGQVLVDDQAWLKYDGCGAFDSTCSVSNLDGEEIIFMNFVSIDGAGRTTHQGKTLNLTYYEVKFLGLNAVTEFENHTAKKILGLIYKNGIVQADGTLDQEKVQRMVEKYGTPVSDRLNRPAGNQTIIIKDESPKSGVNINIGR